MERTVPSLRRVVPRKDFLSPAVEDRGLKLHDTLIGALGLEHIVDAIAIGREGIGKLEFAFADGKLKGRKIVGGEADRVRTVDKRDRERDVLHAGLGESVAGGFVVADQVGILHVGSFVKAPFEMGRIVAHLGDASVETDLYRCTSRVASARFHRLLLAVVVHVRGQWRERLSKCRLCAPKEHKSGQDMLENMPHR